jgi:hypothetical protein
LFRQQRIQAGAKVTNLFHDASEGEEEKLKKSFYGFWLSDFRFSSLVIFESFLLCAARLRLNPFFDVELSFCRLSEARSFLEVIAGILLLSPRCKNICHQGPAGPQQRKLIHCPPHRIQRPLKAIHRRGSRNIIEQMMMIDFNCNCLFYFVLLVHQRS